MKLKLLFIMSVLANAAVAIWALYVGISSDVELANKEEWSILQDLESKYRDNNSEPNTILVKNHAGTGYDLAGMKDSKTSKRIWILTNSKISPKIKLMPEVSEINLSDQQEELILRSLDVNYEVKSFLTIKRH